MDEIENVQNVTRGRASSESRLIALLLCFFFGYLGIHRFNVGRTGSGLLYLLTGGLFTIGWFIDFWVIFAGEFKDSRGLTISQWEKASPITPTPVYQQRNHRRLDDPAYTNETDYHYDNKTQSANKNVKICKACGLTSEMTAVYCARCGAVL